MKARDQNKDQTYFLAQVNQESLCRTLFPLGNLLKSEVKDLATFCGFEKIANKREVRSFVTLKLIIKDRWL